jgi:O-antigen/teichoic acid export membrane protein
VAERRRGRLAAPVVSRSAWALAGQGISSSSNFVLSAIVLATATRAEFATFSIVLMSYLLVTQLCRALLSLPVLILYSGPAPSGVPRPVRSVAGLAVSMGLCVAVPLAMAALISEEGRGQFAALAVLLPLLLYQDVVRHVAFARGDPRAAALSDGFWLVLQLAASAVAIALGHRSPAVLLAVWALAGAVSGCAFGMYLRALPSFRGMAAWVREHWALCAGHWWEFAFIASSSYLLYYGLTILAGADQLGRIRAAQTFIGPVTVALLGSAAIGVPESVRLREDPARLRRMAVVIAAGLGLASLAFGALVYAVLPTIGPELFPDTWSGARPVVPVLSLFSAGLAVSTGAACPLRALGQVRWIWRVRGMTGAITLVIGFPAAARWGANGALGALALTEALFAVLAWRRMSTVMAGPAPAVGVADDGAPWGTIV